MNRPCLETIAVHYAYPGAEAASRACFSLRSQALANANLSIHTGECVALLGANGSGKSTLLLHLNGILRPVSGEVRCEGRALDYSRKGLLALRQQVALVFQDPDDQLFAGTLAQDVSFGPLNLGLDQAQTRQRVVEALAAVDLSDRAELPLHMLSHGQRKRAAIAGALALQPRVLLLDEPTAGLDPEGVENLLGHLDRLIQRGMCVLFSTHDVDLALRWASRVAIMREGAVIASGEPASVLADEAMLRIARLRLPVALAVVSQLSAGVRLEQLPAHFLRRRPKPFSQSPESSLCTS